MSDITILHYPTINLTPQSIHSFLFNDIIKTVYLYLTSHAFLIKAQIIKAHILVDIVIFCLIISLQYIGIDKVVSLCTRLGMCLCGN